MVTPERPSDGRYPFPTVGTAFDYRVRFMFEPGPIQRLVAYAGANKLAQHWGSPSLAVPSAFNELSHDLEELLGSEGAQRGERHHEKRLARVCYGLALYEQCFRSPVDDSWPIVALGRNASWEQVAALAPEAAVEDLVALASQFSQSQGSILGEKRFIPNPTFIGSSALGGADADWISGPRLIDMKTTTESTIERRTLWQVCGYCLADSIDEYKITEVGIYFSRHGVQVAWPLADLLALLAGNPIDLEEVRQEFSSILDSLVSPTRMALPSVKVTWHSTPGYESDVHVWPRSNPMSESVSRSLVFRLPVSGRGKRHVSFAENPVVHVPRDVADPQTMPSCGAAGVVLDLLGDPLILTRHRKLETYRGECCARCLPYSSSRWASVDAYPERTYREPADWRFREPVRSGLRWHLSWKDFYDDSGDNGDVSVCLAQDAFLPGGRAVEVGEDLAPLEADPRYCRHCLLQARQQLHRRSRNIRKE